MIIGIKITTIRTTISHEYVNNDTLLDIKKRNLCKIDCHVKIKRVKKHPRHQRGGHKKKKKETEPKKEIKSYSTRKTRKISGVRLCKLLAVNWERADERKIP